MKFRVSVSGTFVTYLNWGTDTMGHNESTRDFKYDLGDWNNG